MLKLILKYGVGILFLVEGFIYLKLQKKKNSLAVEKREETNRQIKKVFGDKPLNGTEVKTIVDNIQEKFEDKEKRLNQAERDVFCLTIVLLMVGIYLI